MQKIGAYSPREYIEHQLTMSDDEKELRQALFTELFAKHNAKQNGMN